MSGPWTVPTEIAKRLVSPNGLAFLVRARMRGAVLAREATVSLIAGRFVADFPFERPIGTERQASVIVQLGVVAEERP